MRTCDVEGCTRLHEARGLCAKHYSRKWWRENKGSSSSYPDLSVDRPPQKGPCSAEGCERERITKGLCKLHYKRKLRKDNPRTCEFEGCPRSMHTRGLCKPHWQQLRDGQQLTYVAPPVGMGNAKLNEEKVREVWRLLEQGWTQKEVGLHFRVGESTINNIYRGETWKHVTR